MKNNEPSDSSHSIDKTGSLRIDHLPFPDPADSKVSVSYSIDSSSNVVLDVYDSGGIQIHHIENNGMGPGNHVIDLDVKDYPAGVCLFTLRAGREAVSGRLIKVK